MIDLHIHTTSSDGTRTPKNTIIEAYEKKIQAISITDHDTTEGFSEAVTFAEEFNIELIPGVEISAFYGTQEIHILGYYIDVKNKPLQAELEVIKQSRSNRAIQMVTLLNKYNYDISIQEVMEEAKTGTIGRPHIARCLVQKGYYRSTDEVFHNLLSRGKKAYVERYKLSIQDAIELISSAGGISVVAHPGLYKSPLDWTQLIKYGISGVEAFHSKHDRATSKKYKDIATKHGLIVTSGSDCHGNGEASILGTTEGEYSIIENMKALLPTV
ncbi:hypothetical protein BHU72_03735 [Desulfuribacillus stibiiarsenatis]|uniref:Polymerase/histidinol phosphatase N-terminal domain-containing protein n=1 Tax=Desulfuribacillus stibiiarsenatis TaxID=1390249 RepID=A0A1E5L796_9FIRM|nr:PHP domain-containing protein [Desulfuribacillus stibiiarsenatis]OEH85894.1 hypothetical protein BHU72_03735 [Desulfuribacillus stibiiarsenatis]